MRKMKITVVKGFTADEVFDGEVPDYFPETFKSQRANHAIMRGIGYVAVAAWKIKVIPAIWRVNKAISTRAVKIQLP